MAKPTRASEWMTKAGATALASKIRAYWAYRHYAVNVWITEELVLRGKIEREDERTIYGIRSDLINGYPMREARKEAA